MSDVRFWGDAFTAAPPKTEFPTWQSPNYSWSPRYQGLEDGDYGRLEQNLRQPGELAANQAYESRSRDFNAAMSGRGMYGSSLMSQAANEGLHREYANALTTNAANAVAKRYAMQAQDRQFAATQDLQRDSLQNRFNQADAQDFNAYRAQKAAWDDQQSMREFQFNASKAQSRQAFDLAQERYDDQRADLAFNRFNQAFNSFYQNSMNSSRSGKSDGGGFLSGLGSGLGKVGSTLGTAALSFL